MDYIDFKPFYNLEIKYTRLFKWDVIPGISIAQLLYWLTYIVRIKYNIHYVYLYYNITHNVVGHIMKKNNTKSNLSNLIKFYVFLFHET